MAWRCELTFLPRKYKGRRHFVGNVLVAFRIPISAIRKIMSRPLSASYRNASFSQDSEGHIEGHHNERNSKSTGRTDDPSGEAAGQRLAKEIKHVPGRKTRYFNSVPGLREYYEKVKGSIKESALQYQAVQYAKGMDANRESQGELHGELKVHVKKLDGVSTWARFLGKAYIKQKYGNGARVNMQFVTTEKGSEFKTKGTNLTEPVIRSVDQYLFQIPAALGPEERAQLFSETGLKREVGSPRLGKGNFAEVQIARQLTGEGKKFVAVKKFLSLANGADEQAHTSRLQDNENFSRLRSPATLGSRAYLFMDLAGYGDGSAVQKRIKKIEDPDMKSAAQCTLAIQYVKAVQALHAQGQQHRDIKPENFLVKKDGTVLLSDLGLATTTNRFGLQLNGTIVAAGTLGFLDPRHTKIGANAVDADKFSLGATLYTIAKETGNPPCQLPGWEGYETHEVRGNTLEEAAMKLMDKDPANRPNLDELLQLPYFRNSTILSKEEFAEVVKPKGAEPLTVADRRIS
jgi:hypothetical protein